MSKRRKISDFFFSSNNNNRVLAVEEEQIDDPTSHFIEADSDAIVENDVPSLHENVCVPSDPIQDNDISAELDSQRSADQIPRSGDIGLVFTDGERNINVIASLTDFEKKDLLTKHWMPDKNFNFPCTKKGKWNVHLSPKHITGEFGCFKYSPSLCGLLCVPCVLFASTSVANDRRKETMLGQLVVKPLTKYSRLTGNDGYLYSHLKTEYHKTSQELADNFIHSVETNSNVRMAVDSQHKEQVKDNRARLIPIVKTIILCGQLGIAYRRKSNPSKVQMVSDGAEGDVINNSLVAKDGNFLALLEFRVDAGDKTLENHLKNAGKNATYLSPSVQNDLIKICGEVISNSIVKDIKDAKYFTVLADETTDSSHKEQLCLCLRFVMKKEDGYVIREEFLQFQNATDLSGAGLAEQILSLVRQLGLDPLDMVGQGYDGAAAMSGHINGVQANVRVEAPHAVYVHCSSHSLNLVLNSSSTVPELRDMFAVVRECTTFINDSVKRRELMADYLKESGSTRTQLVLLCKTRFIDMMLYSFFSSTTLPLSKV